MTEPTVTPAVPQVEPVTPAAVPQVVTTDPVTPAPAPELFEGEPFDPARAKALIEKLRAENKELKPKAKKADELSEAEARRKEAEMTELQKLQAKLEKADAELKAVRHAEMQRQAAIKVELPLPFADRLVGETPEALEADARKLLESFPKPAAPTKPTPPKVAPTNPGPGASTQETDEQRRARLYGTGINVLSTDWGKAHGGGVHFKEKQPG